MARRWSRAMRARNVARVRVPASARCRSSITRRAGRRSPRRPRTPRMPSSRRAWRRSGTVVSAWVPSPRPAPRRDASSGRSRSSSSVAWPMTSARASSGRAARAGRRARTSGAYGASVPSPNAHPRSTVIGSCSASRRLITSSMKRVVPTPAVPSSSNAPASPAVADWSTDATLVNASSRPTNLGLVNVAGTSAF